MWPSSTPNYPTAGNQSNHLPVANQFPYNQLSPSYPLERSPIGQTGYLGTPDCAREINYGGSSSPAGSQYAINTDLDHWSNVGDIRRKTIEHKTAPYR